MDSVYDTLQLYHKAREHILNAKKTPQKQARSLNDWKYLALKENLENERIFIGHVLYENDLLPHPQYTNNHSLLESTGTNEHRTDYLQEDRSEITRLIGQYQIRDHTLSKSAQERLKFIDDVIAFHDAQKSFS